jgi:hypothetical protein
LNYKPNVQSIWVKRSKDDLALFVSNFDEIKQLLSFFSTCEVIIYMLQEVYATTTSTTGYDVTTEGFQENIIDCATRALAAFEHLNQTSL